MTLAARKKIAKNTSQRLTAFGVGAYKHHSVALRPTSNAAPHSQGQCCSWFVEDGFVTARPRNRIAEEAYSQGSMPANVRQAINGCIKTFRDKLVEAGCIHPEDRNAFIEVDRSR